MNRILLYVCGFVVASIAVAACGELTGPKSPETPINVTATLIGPTTAEVRWAPSPQSDGVVSYNIIRNGQKVGESGTTTFTDAGLSEKTTYKYTVSANCTGGVLSDPSAESPAATVTTQDITPPRIILISPFADQTGVSGVATVTVTFSEAMDPATINTTTFSLKVADTGANIPGTITYNTTTHVAEFAPTNGLPGGVRITVTVTSGVKDLAGNALVLTPGSPGTWTFTTADQQPPTVIATSPANGAVNVSINGAITVTFSEAMDASTINGTNITLRLTSSGAAVGGAVSYNATTHVATLTPSGSLASGANYTITVSSSVKDLAGNQMAATFESTFTTGDTTPPTVTATNPVNGSTSIATNTLVTATFSKAMNASTINTTTFTLKITGGASVAGTVSYNSATFTATFTPTAPLTQGTNYTATITTGAQDTFGNALASNATWAFTTIDTTPPTVTLVSPLNAATGVAVNTAINITFSEAMDASTINTTTITLKNTNTSAAVAGTVSYNSSTHVATFTPTATLSNGTGYTVTVTTGAKDAAGNALASQFTSTFTTVVAPDTTAPTVVDPTYPVNFDTEIPIDTAVTVTFSEAMDQSTITTSTFTLKTTSGGVPVAGTVTYNSLNFTAKFKPNAPLANNTVYTVTVTTGVKDLAGNSMTADKVFSFTTTKYPTVISTSPANNATGVPISTTVTAKFSEAMDASTIDVTTFSLKTTVGSVAVAGTVSYNAGTHVATFSPTASLVPGTNYTATITTGAKDTSGNALTSNYIFTFTTAP